jgi:hypothetical protein
MMIYTLFSGDTRQQQTLTGVGMNTGRWRLAV